MGYNSFDYQAVKEWFEGFEKELREIAELKEYDKKRFEGATLKRVHLLGRAELAKEILGE